MVVIRAGETARRMEPSIEEMLRESPRTLSVIQMGISDADIDAFAQNTTLLELTLIVVEMDDAKSARLARLLASHANLTILRLGYNMLGNAGAISLSINTHLHTLFLDECGIDDAGALALALNPTLRALSLAFNAIGDAGAIALAHNSALSNLDLNFNRVGDAGAEAFARTMTLCTLSLHSNAIGERGASALAASLCAGNARALIDAELRHIKRRIGQHAHGALSRYVDTGNFSLRKVDIYKNGGVAASTHQCIRAALRVRAGWK